MAGGTRARGGEGRRAIVTLAVAAAVLLLARVPAPGLDLTFFRQTPSFDPTDFGVFTFGLGPIGYAALVVELAVVIVPAWRPLRHGGYAERSLIWSRVRLVALVWAGAKAFFLFSWLTHSLGAYGLADPLPDGTPGRLLVAVWPMLGTPLLLLLATVIEKHGAGNGLSVLAVTFTLGTFAPRVMEHVRDGQDDGRPIQSPLLLTLLVLAGIAVATARHPQRGWAESPPRPQLLTPISTLLPLTLASSILLLPQRLQGFGLPLERVVRVLVPGSDIALATKAPLLLGLCGLLAWLFNRPTAVAALWRRAAGGGLDEDAAMRAADRAFRGGLWRSLGLVGAAVALGAFDRRSGLPLDMVTLPVAAAVVLDLAGEHRFRSQHGALAPVWPLYRPYAVGAVLAALERAGIPAYARGLRHSTLLGFAVPYVPAELLVPAAQAERAAALVSALVGPAEG